MDKVALGAGLSFVNDQLVGAQQRQHDREMSALNNKYMVDQWNRENEYNLPSKVAQRYRAAGINPRAVFGSGSASGAGVAGGLSSAPGNSSSVGGYGTFAGLGHDLLTAQRIKAQNKKDEAEAEKAHIEAIGKKYDNEVLAPLRASLQTALRDKAVNDATISKILAQWEPYMADLRARVLEGNISNIDAQTKTYLSQLENDEVFRSLSEEQRKLVLQQIDESKERVLRMAVQNAFDKAQTALSSVEGDLKRSQIALNEALKNKEEKMLPYLDKQIELLASQMNLNEEQIKKWKAEVAQQWTKIGTDIFFSTVAEARQWVGMFMPFGKRNPIGFGKNVK